MQFAVEGAKIGSEYSYAVSYDRPDFPEECLFSFFL